MPIQTLIPPNRLSFHSFSEMFTSFPFLPGLDSNILHRWTLKRMLTLIKYFILDPFYSGPMTSNFLRSWNQLIITQTHEEGSLSYQCKCLHIAIKCNNVCSYLKVFFASEMMWSDVLNEVGWKQRSKNDENAWNNLCQLRQILPPNLGALWNGNCDWSIYRRQSSRT